MQLRPPGFPNAGSENSLTFNPQYPSRINHKVKVVIKSGRRESVGTVEKAQGRTNTPYIS